MVSDASGFSSDFIKTSNLNVGVPCVYNGTVVKPNNAFRTRIVNGLGNDTVTFVPCEEQCALHQHRYRPAVRLGHADLQRTLKREPE